MIDMVAGHVVHAGDATDDHAVRLYNINNDRMTYRHGATVFDLSNGKALAAEAAQKKYPRSWAMPVDELMAICAAPGDGFGSQHTGPRNG